MWFRAWSRRTADATPGVQVLVVLQVQITQAQGGRAVGPAPRVVRMGMVVTAGQRGDSPQFGRVLNQIRVKRSGVKGGRPHVCPERVRADKGYASAANRRLLRSRRGMTSCRSATRPPSRSPRSTTGSPLSSERPDRWQPDLCERHSAVLAVHPACYADTEDGGFVQAPGHVEILRMLADLNARGNTFRDLPRR